MTGAKIYFSFKLVFLFSINVLLSLASPLVNAGEVNTLTPCHQILAIGQIEYREPNWRVTIDYTNQVAGKRIIELPKMIETLQGLENLRILVFAGNSGYENTRHNLAFDFFDQLVANLKPQTTHTSSPETLFYEELDITYDDSTQRHWQTTFKTEKPYFRTNSGEVVLFQNLGPYPVLAIRPIGDYNEIADFSAPIIEVLQIPSSQVMLVRDDLKLAEAEISVRANGAVAYEGNNAQFSMIRSLSYRAGQVVVSRIQTMLAQNQATEWITGEQWTALLDEYNSRVNIRYENHLGSPTAFSMAMKNAATLKQFFKAAIGKYILRVPDQQIQEVKGQLAALKKSVAPALAQLNNKKEPPSETTREILLRQKADYETRSAPLWAQVTAHEERVNLIRQQINQIIDQTIEQQLSFAELKIGTLPAGVDLNTINLRDFVLGHTPQGIFTKYVWNKATLAIQEWLARPSF